MAQAAWAERGQVERLLQPNEQIVDHGLVVLEHLVVLEYRTPEHLTLPVKLPPPQDEGFLLVTDRRLIWTSEGGISMSYPYAYVKAWKYTPRKRFAITLRGFASLRIELRTGFVDLFRGNWVVLAFADTALREGTQRDWSQLEHTVAYFHQEETLHGNFGLMPGVLRCRACETNIYPPLQAYCAGCGRTIDWQRSKPEADAYNDALEELDQRVGRGSNEG